MLIDDLISNNFIPSGRFCMRSTSTPLLVRKKKRLSRTFLSFLTPNKKYTLNANYHGEERAFVVSGQYEKVLPMDILPVYLLKAILAGDLDRMEQLGMYEIAPEDFALCEFVCTSKIPAQHIVEQGIELMMKELS